MSMLKIQSKNILHSNFRQHYNVSSTCTFLVLRSSILSPHFSRNIGILAMPWIACTVDPAQVKAVGQIYPAVEANLSFSLSPHCSSPVCALLLFLTSLVSYVQLCPQTPLWWWICGRSRVSMCLTWWCISTGHNSLSICTFPSSPLPLFPSPCSLGLSFLPSFVSNLWLSIIRHCLDLCLSDGADRADRTHRPTATATNKQETELHNLPIDFHWGHFWNSPSDLLAKW